MGAEGPNSLFSLIAAFTADYSPLTQTAPPLPGKVPLPPRGASWGPRGLGSVELVNGHPLGAHCVGALGHLCLRVTAREWGSEGAPWRRWAAWVQKGWRTDVHSLCTRGSWGPA